MGHATGGGRVGARAATAVFASLLVVGAASGVGAAAPAPPASEPPQSRSATTASAVAFPPGTDASGIENASRLLDAHRERLATSAYRARLLGRRLTSDNTTADTDPASGYPYAFTVENGSRGTSVRLAFADAGRTYWFGEQVRATRTHSTEDGRTTVVYEYDERLAAAPPGDGAGPRPPRASLRRDGRVADEGVPRTAGARSERGLERLPTQFVAAYLAPLEYDYRGRVHRGGDTLYAFAATASGAATDRLERSLGANDVEAASVTVLVSPRGVVRSLDATVRVRDDTRRTRTSYAVRDVGTATVRPPAWLATGLPQFDTSVVGDGSLLALTYTGDRGPTLGSYPSYAGVAVRSPRGIAVTEIASLLRPGMPLAPGDTLYLWRTTGSSGLQYSVNARPTVTDSFVDLGGSRVTVHARRQVARPADGPPRTSVALELWVVGAPVANSQRSENASRRLPTAA